MKTFITILLLISLSSNSRAQNTNGWEFLFWKMDKDSVEKVLDKNKSKLSPPNALDANFKFQEMNTWLFYDTQNKLIKVHQRKDFSVIQNKEAEAFYIAFKSNLKKQYGKPNLSKKDKKNCLVTMTWDLLYTKITFEYDYKYKVIDEFGAGSYWIDIVFESAKTD